VVANQSLSLSGQQKSRSVIIRYRQKWKIYLSCADEEHNVSGEAPVTVLAPSEEQEELARRG